MKRNIELKAKFQFQPINTSTQKVFQRRQPCLKLLSAGPITHFFVDFFIWIYYLEGSADEVRWDI